MSDSVLSPPPSPPAEAARSGLQLVRLPVERPAPAVEFLQRRSEGVMDLLAHFWERLAQTPPLTRPDLHLLVAMDARDTNEHINTTNLCCDRCTGAMLYVPKAHRADVLALDPATAAVFAGYIIEQGPKAVRSDNHEPTPPANATPLPEPLPDPRAPTASHAPATVSVPLTDLSTPPRTIATTLEIPADASPAAKAGPSGNGGSAGGGGNSGGAVKVPIDFLTGNAEGITWMTPLLLAAVHRRTPARQRVNVMMQLPPEVPCQADPNVRTAREADVPTLNRWRRLYKEERGILFDADLDAWVHTQKVFIYEHDKQIVALAKFDLELPRLIEIGGVYTFPEFRKHGFGGKIVNDLAWRIRQTGKTPTLQVDEQNSPALRLYENAGWRRMGKLARVWLTG